MTDRRLQFFPVEGSGARVSINFVRMATGCCGVINAVGFWLNAQGDGRFYFQPQRPQVVPLPVVVFDEVEL